jgi:dihydroorotate dehydrogenase electron transfer subunit
MVGGRPAKIKEQVTAPVRCEVCYSPASMPFDTAARILSHDALNSDHLLLTLDAPAVARASRPGQFVMLQAQPGRDPLLRRPMSVCAVLGSPPRRLQILYKVTGHGTRLLSRQPKGETLAMLGPLGNGFRLPPEASARAGRQVMVAGGVGIAIFPFLAGALARLGHRPLLLFGARKAADLVGLDLFGRGRIDAKFATEDGSRGTRGYVTSLLEKLFAAPGPKPSLYVCGPTPMLRAVGDQARRAGIACQLALESQMPCGIGVCLGCVVAAADPKAVPPYPRVCTEGPVFEAGSVRP